jgi:hypothetical protein
LLVKNDDFLFIEDASLFPIERPRKDNEKERDGENKNPHQARI